MASTGIVNPIFQNVPRENCSNVLPSSHVYFEELGVVSKVEAGILGGVTLITLVIYIAEIANQKISLRSSTIVHRTSALFSLHPVYSCTSLVAVLVPRFLMLSELVAAGFSSFCLYNYFNMMLSYYGGEDTIVDMAGDIKLALRGPPCCCCCFCCPVVSPTKKNLTRIRLAVFQCALLQPIIRFLSAVLWTEGFYSGSLNFNQPVTPVIEIINMATLLTALYGLLTMHQALKPHLKNYHPDAKFRVLMVVFPISTLQKLVLSILAMNNVIPCIGTISPIILGNAIHHAFLIVEVFLFMLLARFYFMKSLQEDLFNMQSSKADIQSGYSVSHTTLSTFTTTTGHLGVTSLPELTPEATTVAL
ncbi:hypothetical protein SNE40_020625 [Patella caerulea]|uniref:Organic solute transporter subunit alpha n=1 Tax=Patella caerulea TaxID=87958 RepID=A0AAN8J4S2_PATCE